MSREALVAVSCLFVVACADPGGGTGNIQDSASGQDVILGDGSGGDGSHSGSGCANGARQCSGQIAQQCVNGVFKDLFECPSTQVCEAGACKAGEVTQPDTSDTTQPDPCQAKECGPDGQGGQCGQCNLPEACNPQGQCVAGCTPQCQGKECGSDLCGGSCGTCGLSEQCVQGSCEATEVCDCEGAVCGVDNCGNSCGTCQGQTTCSGGVCVSNTAGGSCVDMIDCIYGDLSGCSATATSDDEFSACVDVCYAASSQTGVDEFEAYLGCLQACPQPDDDPGTTDDDLTYQRCSYNECSGVESECILDGAGSGTCFEIFDCMDLCADGDSDCYKACYEDASLAAQTALWGLNSCLSVECPDETDTVCQDAAIADQCADFVFACQTN